ncbi:MAG: DMT family transporter [Rhodobacterales bacterium]|nr:DMT family transporter [Rhodobacterales bacterium]
MAQPPSTGQRNEPGRGIAWILLTMLLFVSMDTLAKHLAATYPVAQVVWARYTFHFLLLAAILHRRLPDVARTKRLGFQAGRALLLAGTTALFFTGLRYVPLASASAMMFIAPLMVTGLSVPLLGERVGPRRWAAVAVGFVGAMIIIRPGTAAMDLAMLLPLGAAFLYAFYQIATRELSRTDAPMTTLVYTALVGGLVSSLVVPFSWQAPTAGDWGLMVLMGLFGGTSQFALIKAFQSAPASVVTPFSYSSLIWATTLGFLVFGDLPDGWTVVGALVIAASGLYVFAREMRGRGNRV